MYIYDNAKKLVKEFVIRLNHDVDVDETFHTTNMILDVNNTVLISIYGKGYILRYNLNGKKLPNIILPGEVKNVAGIAAAQNGDLYIFSLNTRSIFKLPKGIQSEWEEVLTREHYAIWEDESLPYSFSLGQLVFGPDGYLYIAAQICIIVVDPISKVYIRRIGAIEHKGGIVGHIQGVFVSADGYVFGMDPDEKHVYIFKADGSYVGKLRGTDFGVRGYSATKDHHVAVDYYGYIFVSNIRLKKILIV